MVLWFLKERKEVESHEMYKSKIYINVDVDVALLNH